MISIGPLKALMVQKDLTWELLSQVSGIPLGTFGEMKKGRSITPQNINILCRTLGCQPKDIIKYESECVYCTKDLGPFRFCPMCGRKL